MKKYRRNNFCQNKDYNLIILTLVSLDCKQVQLAQKELALT